ncbi:MAG: YggS family pyridoxal phosphate-dependent enzyme [Pseudomonadota bacterium]
MPLEEIKERMRQAEVRAGRDPGSTCLIAVSKVQPLQRVTAVLESGHRVYGENKVQEASGKWPDLKEAFPGVTLHLVGPLQTNKVKAAFELFDALHAVDRSKLVQKIAGQAQTAGRCPELFIQVNTGEEPQKAGVHPRDADGLIEEARKADLPVAGLMCIPPQDEEPSLHFALLAKIAERNGLSGLSMGMSADFESAIAQGATHIRVGSAVFGARDYG